MRALFVALSGAVGRPTTPAVFWRGMRTVAVDATCLHVANSWQVLGRYARRAGEKLVVGYPLLRLTVLVECGTRAVVGAGRAPSPTARPPRPTGFWIAWARACSVLADAGYEPRRLLSGAGLAMLRMITARPAGRW